MPEAGIIAGSTILRSVFHAVPSWIGMGMNSSAIPRNSEIFRRDQTTLHRGNNGNTVKKLLKSGFEIKWDVFSVLDTLCNDFCDLRFRFCGSLPISLRFLWLFRMPGRRKHFSTFIKVRGRGSP